MVLYQRGTEPYPSVTVVKDSKLLLNLQTKSSKMVARMENLWWCTIKPTLQNIEKIELVSYFLRTMENG